MAICYPLSVCNWLQNEWPRMTLSANFTSKSVFDQQGCRPLTFALGRLSCYHDFGKYGPISIFFHHYTVTMNWGGTWNKIDQLALTLLLLFDQKWCRLVYLQQFSTRDVNFSFICLFFCNGELLNGALPYWRLQAFLQAVWTVDPEVQGLKNIIDCPQLGRPSSRTPRPPPIGRWSKCSGNDTVMVLLEDVYAD